MPLITFNAQGIYCSQADIYIDPWKPVKRALITHAHSDHARAGSTQYLCHRDSLPLLKLRLGNDIIVEGLGYGEEISINNVRISFHPAGHIIGSAQVKLEYKGEVWVITSDYKLMNDGVSTPFESISCHHFVTETTFGLPVFKFPQFKDLYEDLNNWCSDNAALGLNSIILGYALGKSQVILHHLDGQHEVYVHGAVANVNDALTESRFRFRGKRILPNTPKGEIRNAVVVAPMSAMGSAWLRKLQPSKIAICSGWMQLRGTRRRYGVDRGFVLSDHCDWSQLNDAVLASKAQHIYTTHGYQHIFGRWLEEQYGLEVTALQTLFDVNDENEH